MAKRLSRKEVEKIVKRDAPGHRVVEYPVKDDSVARWVKPDEGTPDLASLKRKYGGSADADAVPAGALQSDEPEDQLVAIAPEAAPNPWDHGSKPKVVLISGKDKKIVASQG